MLDTTIEDAEVVGGDKLPATPRVKTTGICVLGSHPITVDAAPYGDPSWAVYCCSADNTPFGLNKRAKSPPRVDQFFEMHMPLEDPSRPFPYLKFVSEMPFVWLRDERALKTGMFKGGHLFPEKELRGTFERETIKVPTGTLRQVAGPDGKPQLAEIMERREAEIPNMDGVFNPYAFTSSIAYMLAKAIVDCEQHGIKQIGLWGIMQQSDNEFVYQRPGIQYFLYEAIRRGIKVVANRESCLLDMPQWKW